MTNLNKMRVLCWPTSLVANTCSGPSHDPNTRNTPIAKVTSKQLPSGLRLRHLIDFSIELPNSVAKRKFNNYIVLIGILIFSFSRHINLLINGKVNEFSLTATHNDENNITLSISIVYTI